MITVTTRLARAVQLAFFAVLVLSLLLWTLTPSRISHSIHAYDWHLADQNTDPYERESPILTPSRTGVELEDGNRTVSPIHLSKLNPSFHLLITNATRSPQLCRTILSAAVLNYPPPTLVGYYNPDSKKHKKSKDGRENHDQDDGEDEEPDVEHETPDLDTVQALDNLLSAQNPWLRDEDLLLVVEGGTSWFQLPSSVLVHRYEQALKTAYASHGGNPNRPASDITTAAWLSDLDQAVVLGARYSCSLSDLHPACQHFDNQEKHTGSSASTPKFPDSQVVMGYAPAMRSLFSAAARESKETGGAGEEVMALAYSRQDRQRHIGLKNTAGGRSNSWETWFKSKMSGPKADDPAVKSSNNFDDEVDMILDHDSDIFLMDSVSRDLDFIIFNNGTMAAHDRETGERNSLVLPPDVETAPSPFYLASVDRLLDERNSTSIAWNDTIDAIPEDLSWNSLPLATLTNKHSVPAVLHGSSDAYAHYRWRQMWFHQYARALLRNYMRLSEGPHAARIAALGGDAAWDVRGGQGGVWTSDGHWLDFGDVCHGYESELFGDGYGPWGSEGGGHPHCFRNGVLYMGEGVCPDAPDPDTEIVEVVIEEIHPEG